MKMPLQSPFPILEEIDSHVKALTKCVQSLAKQSVIKGEKGQIQVSGSDLQINYCCVKCAHRSKILWEVSIIQEMMDLLKSPTHQEKSEAHTQAYPTQDQSDLDITRRDFWNKGSDTLPVGRSASGEMDIDGPPSPGPSPGAKNSRFSTTWNLNRIVPCPDKATDTEYMPQSKPSQQITRGALYFRSGRTDSLKSKYTRHSISSVGTGGLPERYSLKSPASNQKRRNSIANTTEAKEFESKGKVSGETRGKIDSNNCQKSRKKQPSQTVSLGSSQCFEKWENLKEIEFKPCKTSKPITIIGKHVNETKKQSAACQSESEPKRHIPFGKHMKQLSLKQVGRVLSPRTHLRDIRSKVGSPTIFHSSDQKAKLHSVCHEMNALNLHSVGERRSKWLFEKHSCLMWCWESAFWIALIYIAIVIPIRAGFYSQYSSTRSSVIHDVVLDVLFILNILVQLNTSHKDPITHEAVTNRRAIANHYFKGTFVKDVLCAFPFQTLVATRTVPSTFSALGLVRLVSCEKLIGSSSLEIVEAWLRNPVYIRMGKIIVLFLLTSHFVSCAYWAILLNKNTLDQGRPWIPTPEVFGGPLADKYAKALSISLGMLAGNSMGPLTPGEFWFECTCIILGFIINATIIASASTIIRNMDLQAIERQEQIDSITQYMRSQGVPSTLQTRVQKYFNYLWDAGLSSCSQKVVDQLPPNLELEINLSLKKDLVEKCPLFKMCSFQGVIAIIQNLSPIVAQPKDIVVRSGEHADSMFFINKGVLSVFTGQPCASADGMLLVKLGQGAFFGEVALINERCNKRTATVIADTFVELQELKVADFQVLLGSFPELKQTVKYIVDNRLKLTEQVALKSKTVATFGLCSSRERGSLNSLESSGSPGSLSTFNKVGTKVGTSLRTFRKISARKWSSSNSKDEKSTLSNLFYNEILNTKGCISYAMARDFKAGQGIMSRSIVKHPSPGCGQNTS